MPQYELREMSIGEILDSAFAIYRTNFSILISIAVVCVGLPTLMYVFMTLAGGQAAYPLMAVVTLVLSALGGLISAGATVWAISEIYLGREPNLGDAISFAIAKIGKIFTAGLAKYILVILGLMLLFIPGIIVACGYAVVVQVAVLEDLRSGTDALGRSWNLTRGFKGKAFALGFTVFLLVYMPLLIAGVISGILTGFALWVDAAGQVVGLFVYPLIACAFTLFYYDLRVRQEAFDLEILSQTLEHAVVR